MKVFFIVPHLSTGGMPEYLKNKIEKIKDSCDIWVLEKSHERTYNTIRKRIESLIGEDRIVTWGVKKKMVIDMIESIKPDVIHFEEPCEHFLSDDMLLRIFSKDRNYRIIETFHDSSMEAEEKRFLPDKFIVVSPWQVKLLQKLKVPMEVIEHKLKEKPVRNSSLAKKKLGMDPSRKHIVQIGIFTPRKNQAETINIARILSDCDFYFIGTLADNFKWYWTPLMENLPSNCKVLGERDDVDLFYEAADLIIFPSVENFNDKETSPLVLKEATSWKAPLLMKNTPVYSDMYQESDLIHFMGDSISYNANKILKIFGNMENTAQKFFGRFEPEENKIIINLMENNVGDVNVSIKDRDSNTCIYSFSLNADHSGSEWWTIPIPKPYFDFQEDRNFSGFLIEFYSSQTGEIIQSLTIDLGKKPIMKKRIVANGPINFDPIFVNYTQFFVDGIYNQFFAGSRISTAIDIGANVGLFTEWVLDRFGSDTRVISVEPNSKACLSFESIHSEKENVTLDKLAVTSTDGETIRLMVNPENTLISSVEGTGDGYSEFEEVGTVSLMGLMKKYDLEEVDLLKVDVEGAEYDIFSSVGENDLRRFKHLLIEFHNNQGRASALISKIASAGFEIDLRDDDTRYTVDQNNDRGTIFATRK